MWFVFAVFSLVPLVVKSFSQIFTEESMRTGVDFTNILHAAFTCADPKSIKNTDDLTVFFGAFGICPRKSCLSNVGEIG